MQSPLPVIVIILAVSLIPAAAAVLWERRRGLLLSPYFVLISIGAGVLSIILAMLFSSFLPDFEVSGPLGDMARHILRTAVTEEAARLAVFAVLFAVLRLKPDDGRIQAGGLLAGLAFAAVETAVHAATNAGVVLIRAISAAPLHGACGIRCAQAARGCEGRAVAVCRFITAVLVHGCYNLLLSRGGILPAIAVFLAISSLFSAIRSSNPTNPTV